MRASQILIPTMKEDPADADVASHRLMLRAGLIRQVASGLYTWLPLGLRVLRKVEQIVREELTNAGAQEVLMPVVQPAELWQDSERWDKMGAEMLRIKDRHDRDFCLGPTHEEVITDLFRREVQSYKSLPLNFFQIQTKFRDERRPRFGVMRAREFIMKDGYSFHTDEASFAETYQAMFDAYTRICSRMLLKFRAVDADTGNIGGANSHEFHVLADSGEDVIAYAEGGTYAANLERAEAVTALTEPPAASEDLTKVATPNVRTISDLGELLGNPADRLIKTLIVHGEESPVALVLRGDHELNEIKAGKLDGVASPVRMATDAEITSAIGAEPGSLGVVGLTLPCYVDRSAAVLSDFVCGANETGFHYTGVNWQRDVALEAQQIADLRNVVPGDPSPDGIGVMAYARGIEVGHIFQLGTTYSEAMSATVLDENGRDLAPIMGCYGIGITRFVAAVIEQYHDDNGITWPEPVAPFSVHILALAYEKSEAVRDCADALYTACKDAGLEVLLDDRKERPGVKFNEADLIGLPHRITVGDRNLKEGKVEYRKRSETDSELIDHTDVVQHVLNQRL